MATIELDPIARLTRDLIRGIGTLSPDEARFLVDGYYQMQDRRIATAGQIRSMKKSGEPHDVLLWFFDQTEAMEGQVQRALDAWTNTQPVGVWLKSIYGIGPVIAAGILANAPIGDHQTAGQLWAFAGLAPGVVWEKSKKRPWNADLKVLCWKAGESFVKFHKHPDCYYGHIYAARKAQEIERNERGDFADQAVAALQAKRYRDDTVAKSWYERGKLPPAHIHARARRVAVKLWLAHYFEVAYTYQHGTPPPLPYPIAILGHAHHLVPPGNPPQPNGERVP